MVERTCYLDLDNDDYDIKLKPIQIKAYVIGEAKSGKTSLINRILYNSFTLYYSKTKSIEIYKTIEYPQISNSNCCRPKIYLQLWDVPSPFEIKKIGIHDILIVVVNDKIPMLPSVAIRTWVLYRNEKPQGICNKKIKIDNLENIGIKKFINSVLKEFTTEFH